MHLVREASFVPIGPAYDPRRLLEKPVRALRGGADGIAAGFSWAGGSLGIAVMARGACTAEDEAWAFEKARAMAAIDDDPSDFLARIEGHPLLGDLGRRHDVRMKRTPTLFEALAQAIIEQLVTGWESRRSTWRLWALAGEAIPGTAFKAAPTPLGVTRVPMWKMHAIGIGSKRAATLMRCAKRGDSIERLRALPAEDVIEKLCTLPGVGPWTANLTTEKALGHTDAVPVFDVHAPRIVSQVLGGLEDGDNESMLRLLEEFRPHRARVVKLVQRAAPRDRPPPKVDRHRREPWKY